MRTFRLMMILGLVAAGCGSDGSTSEGEGGPPYDVDEVVISHDTTQEISVWAPTQDGSWPVILLAHGTDGFRGELALTAKALASEGHVVFVPDIRTDPPATLEYDSACSYRHAMSVATEHHGDLDQPITFVGHSLGASTVLMGGLNEARYGPGGTFGDCDTGAPVPDVIVPIAGCHYEYLGTTFAFEPIPSSWTNSDAQLTLVAGQNDETCEPWQSENAAEALRAVGYDVSYVEIEGATHPSIISNEIIDGEWVLDPDAPGAAATVETILAAIEQAHSDEPAPGDDAADDVRSADEEAAVIATSVDQQAAFAALPWAAGVDGHESQRAAVEAFLEFLDLADGEDGTLGVFTSHDESSGQMEFQFSGGHVPVMTVQVQRSEPDGTWWVTGAASDTILVRSPTPNAVVDEPFLLDFTNTAGGNPMRLNIYVSDATMPVHSASYRSYAVPIYEAIGGATGVLAEGDFTPFIDTGSCGDIVRQDEQILDFFVEVCDGPVAAGETAVLVVTSDHGATTLPISFNG